MQPSRGRQLADAVGVLAVAAGLAAGVALRLQEPLSSPVIPAEDPFTHMARVKAHLATGGFEPTGPFGEELYPPGMHAMLAAVWAFTGGELYTIVRFAPVVFGGLSIVGTALLLWRHAGRVAAFVGALAVALAPEMVFRTTMMAPTAVDVALLPFLVYALLEVVGGRARWVPIAAALALFVVFSHPWLVGMIAAAGVVFGLLTVALPWSGPRSQRPTGQGLALAVAVVGGSLALVLSTCAGLCGPGYQQVLPVDGWLVFAAPLVLLASLVPLGALWLGVGEATRSVEAPSRPLLVRVAVAAALALVLVGLTGLAFRRGFPEFVNLQRMLGWPLVGLAAAGFVAAGLRPGPLAATAVGLAVATFPLTIFPPLGSGFVSHRIVVYLGFAAALLAGVFVQGIVDAGRRLTPGRGRSRSQRWAGASAAGLAVTLAVAGAAGGAIAVNTPEPYEEGWYRLYEPCEMEGMQAVADRVRDADTTVIVTGDWRPNTVLSALVDAGPRVWFSQSFFVSAEERGGVARGLETRDGAAYVLVDRHLRTEKPELDMSFLHEEPWTQIGSWCGEIGPTYELRLYVDERTR